jgi:hypothetical protein
MAFRIACLIGSTDIASPTRDNAAAMVNGTSSFAVEGYDGHILGRFQVEVTNDRMFVQVEGLKDRDQFVLVDPSLGELMIRAIIDEEENQYPTFCFPNKDLVLRALTFFWDTGKRDPDCNWISISKLLGQYDLMPAQGAGSSPTKKE